MTILIGLTIYMTLGMAISQVCWWLSKKKLATTWIPCLMTDRTPNDLSHLSDAEFQSLCPQGEHAPGPEPLSPAAQKVLRAAQFEVNAECYAPWIAAATLRAASAHLGSCNASEELIRIAEELEGQ